MSDTSVLKKPVLEIENLSKSFGGVQALEDFNLSIAPGEIVGLVGDNGAGKSTVIKSISGVHAPTSGDIRIDGESVRFATPGAARKQGIETVYQDTGLVDGMDLSSNFFLGREQLHPNPILKAWGHVNRKMMHQIAEQAIAEVGVYTTGSDRKPVGLLSGGQRASILIGRAAHFGSKILLLDEPTAALGVEQSGHVLEIARKVAAQGIAIIVISHNMQEICSVSDRIVVLRLGRKVIELTGEDANPVEVVNYITGAKTSA